MPDPHTAAAGTPARHGGVVTGLLVAFLTVTVLLPLVLVVATATGGAGSADGGPLLGSFLHSLVLATTVAAAGSALALCTSLVAQSLAPRWRHLVDLVVCAPAVLPPPGVAAAVLATAGNAGWLHPPLTRSPVHGTVGMAWAMLLAFVPLAHLLDRAALRTLDPRTLEAASMSGAGAARILRRVVLPHIAPAVALGACVLLTTAMSDPSVPAVLRGRTPNLAHLALDTTTGWGQDAVAARAALAIAVPALLLLPGLALFRSRLAGVWVPGSHSPRPTLPGGPRGALLRVPALVHVALSLCALGTVLTGATTALAAPRGGDALADALGVVSSTVLLSGAACALALPLAVATVWTVRSGRHTRRGAGRLVLWLTVLPGTTVGIAFSLAYRVPPTVLGVRLPALVGGASLADGSVGIVLMLMTVALPVLHVGLGALWDAVPRSVLESARDAGAGKSRLVLSVVLPSTGLLLGALAAATLGRCLVAVVPLAYVTSPDAALVVTRVLDLTDHSRGPETFLVSTLTAAVAGVLLALVQAAHGHLLPRLEGMSRP